MKIVSRYPYLWPHLGFSLKVGENDIDESKIPLAAHQKLLHLSKPGAPIVTQEKDSEGNLFARETPTPAPISGYVPGKALSDAADKHARRPAVKPPVATLETLAQTPAPESPKADEQRGQKR